MSHNGQMNVIKLSRSDKLRDNFFIAPAPGVGAEEPKKESF